jgi:hypothetical protein
VAIRAFPRQRFHTLESPRPWASDWGPPVACLDPRATPGRVHPGARRQPSWCGLRRPTRRPIVGPVWPYLIAPNGFESMNVLGNGRCPRHGLGGAYEYHQRHGRLGSVIADLPTDAAREIGDITRLHDGRLIAGNLVV